MPRIALVTWRDARRTDDEVTGRETPATVRESVGWVLRDDEEGVTIGMTRDDIERFERGFMIPRDYVKSRKWLT